MKRVALFLLIISFAIVAIFVGLNYPILSYGYGQLQGQMKVISNARPLEEYLNSEEFPDSLKQKIGIIQEAKRYAIDSLGLNPSNNYQDLYDQKGKAILWVVTAAPEFSLEAHQWDYPFLGEMEYKGFFDSTKAVDEANRLIEEGFDATVGEVEAWSTLGFFNDPILSNMLDREDGMLARLIIHELTHSTIFVASNSELNENLATFIGNEGAYLYLEDKFGIESEEYAAYENRMRDIRLFSSTAMEMRSMLEAFYEGMSDSLSLEQKRANKKLFFHFALDQFRRLPFTNSERFKFLESDTVKASNTFFSGMNTYHAQQDSLQEVFEQEYNEDLRSFINGMKQAYQ